jgi:YegS/Rv2252/BmrU family lipid kinase
MRARLIVNPKSGADRAPVFLPMMNRRLREIVQDLDITMTTGVADVERAASRALDEGCDALYVAGGDGTLNAALRTIMARNASRQIVIGVIPFGTGNDFAKALGLGEEPEPAIEALLEGLAIDVDVGMLNDRPFVNTSAGGFIADVSDAVTESLKDAAGKLAYVIGGARALFGTEPFSARLSIAGGDADAPDSSESLDVQMFAACNSRFIGGGYVIAPEALIDDGLLDVLVVPRMPMLEFVAVLQRLAVGSDAEHPGVRHFTASSFTLELSRRARVNTDGELLEADSCRYVVLPRAARFFCGRAPHAHGRPARVLG